MRLNLSDENLTMIRESVPDLKATFPDDQDSRCAAITGLLIAYNGQVTTDEINEAWQDPSVRQIVSRILDAG